LNSMYSPTGSTPSQDKHLSDQVMSPISPFSPTASSRMSVIHVSSPTITVRVATPPAIPNPFDDPTTDGPQENSAPPSFSEIEIVCRPFMPTLDDELSVALGDAVHIVDVFDDGWAYVEKKSGLKPERGLIPIDCLRETGQDLPAFLAAKRVSSSYHDEDVTAMAI